MTARRVRWALALVAIVLELTSFVAWRVWVTRHVQEPAAAG